jgi:hypothetical protein
LRLRLALGEHQRRFLFGQDLELFLLFSDLHRRLLGPCWELVGACLVGRTALRNVSSIDPQEQSKVKGCSAAASGSR